MRLAVDADGFAAQRRVPRRPQRVAERREHDDAQDDDRERGNRQRQPVEGGGARRPFVRPDPQNAVVAAGHRDPLERDRPDDLRKGERQHRKIDAGELHAEEAEHGCTQAAEQGAEQQRDDHRQPRHFGEERDAIGAEPEIGGVAERGEPADRHQEMQARGKDHEDRDLGADGERVIAGDEGQHRGERQSGQRGDAFIRGHRPPRIDRQSRRAARGRLGLSEQAPGPHDQHHGHDEEDEDDGDFWKDQDAKGVELGDQHGRDKGADDAAEAADHDHDEHFDDDAQVHGVMHGIARDLQRAAERREEDADGEHRGEQPFLIDAERCDHVAVLRRGAHQNAPAGALEQKVEDAEHDRAEHDQEQIVGRDILAEEIDRALEAGRAAADQIVRAPDQHHEVLHHQRQAEGGEQLEQFRRMIDPAQQHHLDQHAEDGDDKGGDDDAAPKAERAGKALGQRERDIGADHVEGAMGEIDDAGDAEDDREAGRHQEQRCRAGETGQELDDVEGHEWSGSAFTGIGGFILRDGAFAPPQDEGFLTSPMGRGRIAPAIRVRGFGPTRDRNPSPELVAALQARPLPSGEVKRSILRTQLLDFGVARQKVRALLVGRADHDALAVLQRGLADIGTERRLVVDLAEGDLAEG